MSKRRRGFPSETQVKKGHRVVHGTEAIVPKDPERYGEAKAAGTPDANVEMAAIPEPSTVLMIGIGLAVIGGMAIRKRRTQILEGIR